MQSDKHFDTIILGSGISGTALASILAQQGFRVLLLEKGTHPRFAIGESMLPQTSMWMWIVGERFGVPEMKNLTNAKAVQQHVSSSCGVKRNIGFVYHREGETQNPNDGHQLIPPENPFFSESHLFRQDVDLYMLNAAIGYGVVYRDLTELENIDFQEDEVRVKTKDGEEYSARFLVDGSGYRSLVAQKFNLREKPTRLRTNSRAIFTHVTGLRPYDDCISEQADSLGQSRGWHEGTLHHVFDGGWLWIIPFDNHSKSENSVCSIGLMLDAKKFPKKDLSPEQEFQEIVERFPSVAEHLKDSKPVRKWVSTDRLQYSSTKSVGHRYALLSSTYGFIDPLYSRGLLSTFETIHALAGRLIGALKDDDFSPERFAYVDKLQAAQLDDTDKIIYNAYRSMSHFELWNAWTQLWLATVIFGDTYIFSHCLKYMDSGDVSLFAKLEEDPCPIAGAPFARDMKSIVNGYETVLDLFEAEELEVTASEAASYMLDLLGNSDWLPKSIYPWGSPTARHIDFNLVFRDWITWGKSKAPSAIREEVFDFPLPELELVTA